MQCSLKEKAAYGSINCPFFSGSSRSANFQNGANLGNKGSNCFKWCMGLSTNIIYKTKHPYKQLGEHQGAGGLGG
jgi:hypothetical protein